MQSDRKTILNLAIPAVFQTVLRSLFIIIDAFWIGKLGSAELAALTVATFIVWGVLELGDMVSTGNNSLVSQSTGARDFTLAQKISSRNIVHSFIHSLITGISAVFLLPFLYYLMNLNNLHSLLADEYLIILLIGLPCIILLSTINSVFRGYGDTKTPFWLLLFALSLNFVLNPVLIFGINGFLKFGIKGAAIATIISYFLSFILGFYLAHKRNHLGNIRLFIPEFNIFKETLKIGLPVSLNGLAFSFIYVIIARFVSEYGTVGFASMGISHRSESLSYQITVGFSLAASILTGQFTGKNETKRAETLALKTLRYGSIVILVYAIFLFFFSSEIASLFTDDLKVIKTASLFNKLTAVVINFSALEVILSGAFSGAGDSLPPSIISTSVNILRIPLTGLLSVYTGLTGIWIGICITVVLKGILIYYWFMKGKWKNKKTKLLKKEPQIHFFD